MPSFIKVLYIASDNNPTSGAFLEMVDLIDELKTNYNIIPVVVVPYHNLAGEKLLKTHKIKFYVVKSEDWVIKNNCHFFRFIKKIIKTVFYNFAAFLSYNKIIKKENVQIIHINTSFTYVAAFSSKKMKVPLIWHFRECVGEAYDSKIICKNYINIVKNATKIIFISNTVRDKYTNLHLIPNVVIYDGIKFQNFKNKKILDKEIIEIVYVGAIYLQKGIYDLFNSIIYLTKKYNFLHYTIVGDGEIKRISNIVEKENLSTYVSIVGSSSNPLKYIENADIGIVPSWFEGFGRTAAEIASCGRLLICSNSGALREIYKDRKTALFHKINNNNSISKCVEFALFNKNVSRSISKNGMNFVRKKFSISSTAEKIFKEYYKIIK